MSDSLGTRLAILADVHANLPALQAVVEDLQRCGAQGILVAGDLTVGPQPIETIALLRTLDARMIVGNSDINLLRYDQGDAPAAWYTSRQFALLRWGHRRMDVTTLAFLHGLPQQHVVQVAGTGAIRMVHGSPRSPYEGLDPLGEPDVLRLALAETREPVLLCGHTHKSWVWEQDGRLACNPGAVCDPLDGFVGAEYALLDWDGARWRPTLRSIPYDLRAIRAAFTESGLLAEGGVFARAFMRSIETGRNVTRAFLGLAHEFAVQAGQDDSQVVPDEAWEQASASFDWSQYNGPA